VSTGEGASASPGSPFLDYEKGLLVCQAGVRICVVRTLLDNIRATFFFHVSLVGEPLDTLAECVHIRILENVDSHDHLVVPKCNNNPMLMMQMKGGFPYNKCEIALRVRLMSQPARWAIRATWLVPSIY
jgi:hypothetical protein